MIQTLPTRLSLAVMLVALAACSAPARSGSAERAGTPLSCKELAQRRATEQYDADTESADQRFGGAVQDSSLRQQLRAMDAAARQRAVYEQCLKLRATPAAPPEGAGTVQ